MTIVNRLLPKQKMLPDHLSKTKV